MPRNKDGTTPLQEAAAYGTRAKIQALLAAGADVMARNKDGRTPLHSAATCYTAFGGCKPGVIQTLLAAGADGKAKVKKRQNPVELGPKKRKKIKRHQRLLGAERRAV